MFELHVWWRGGGGEVVNNIMHITLFSKAADTLKANKWVNTTPKTKTIDIGSSGTPSVESAPVLLFLPLKKSAMEIGKPSIDQPPGRQALLRLVETITRSRSQSTFLHPNSAALRLPRNTIHIRGYPYTSHRAVATTGHHLATPRKYLHARMEHFV